MNYLLLLNEMLELSLDMRQLQIEYFKTRNPKVLSLAKKAEKLFDVRASEIRNAIEELKPENSPKGID